MDGSARAGRGHPGPSYEEILSADIVPAPAFLREGRVPDIGVDPIATARYYDPEFFRKEARHVWSRVWQMACREEDIANVGDYHIYNILDRSLIVVRSAPNQIKAFYNSCLHRGRKLVTLNGCKKEFRCPFHGLSWTCDGAFKDNPLAWDLPQWEGRDMRLPEARTATWGGFVFVNFDADAEPLMNHIAPLAEHFAPYDFADRYRAVWVSKKVRANWKATAEAFMESHHSLTTHPQILPGLGDVNSQYDLPNDHVSRHFSAAGVSSPFLPPLSEEEIFAYMTSGSSRRKAPTNADAPKLPQGMSARAAAADLARKGLGEETGADYANASDAEMIDALLYNVFPNMCFWGGYASNLIYRWRPNGNDPESSIMDVMILRPCAKDGPRPKGAPLRELGIDQPWSDAPELGGLTTIFEQDMGNLPFVQEGLHASATGVVHFARYTEMRIRHLHKMIDRYIAEGESASPTT